MFLKSRYFGERTQTSGPLCFLQCFLLVTFGCFVNVCVSLYICVNMRVFVCSWLCEGDWWGHNSNCAQGTSIICMQCILCTDNSDTYHITVIKNIKRLVVSGGFGDTATLASTEVICRFKILIQPLVTSLIIAYPCHSLTDKVMLLRITWSMWV